MHLTGFDALADDSGSDSDGPGVLLEAVLGGFGALIVLTFVFASFLAFVPLMTAVVSIMTTFLLLLGLTEITDVSPIVQFLIALIGLGVAIDYSLLVVSRWREERSHGRSNEEAVQRAMETAGRAVIFSGITVAIGLFALIALPLPFLRSMGYGGMLIPLVSTVVAITLLPVILAKLGPRLDWPHRRTDDKASRAWTRWAEAVSRRRWLAAGAGMAVILALVFAAADLQLGTSDADTIAKSGDAKEGLVALEDAGIGEGSLLPHEVLVEGGTSPEQVAADLRGVEGIHGAVAPDSAEWRRDGTAIVEAIPVPDSGSDEGGATLEGVRDAAHSAGPDVRVGGQPASNSDFIDAVYGSFPLMIALITITTFILLARAFRSLLLPLKAIVLNVLSVAAAWGVLVLVWQHGFGSEAIFGIEATGSIPSWMPLIIFAFLFGLSMDTSGASSRRAVRAFVAFSGAEIDMERRLAAIFAADVVGYSRLVGADEEGTIERFNEHRRQLIDPKIAEHQGRIVKTHRRRSSGRVRKSGEGGPLCDRSAAGHGGPQRQCCRRTAGSNSASESISAM